MMEGGVCISARVPSTTYFVWALGLSCSRALFRGGQASNKALHPCEDSSPAPMPPSAWMNAAGGGKRIGWDRNER